ncbi:PaaX family transcriptional regulator C-terminal domain-containing protein [uncultured Tateyamaria sp.]|uniref:PaaX family transcriptional regulator C-terminal domain-containing protein n=1 Tax=uncultured Tateyamaria sp. TaxID=455651 RepID=UPI00260AA42B|nr:PaaX family transcriptional regulator C-terminal domain-containing protein [uncultured Tateyamaria sp.]
MRVWSLLVTVFGDLAPDRPLKGPTLSAIMAEIGIKPEASRVALHRLRSDGWIVSEKQGRTSLHALTHKGQSDSDAARRRIYGDIHARDAVLFLTTTPVDLDSTRFAQIAPRVFMAAQDAPAPQNAIRLIPDSLPTWLGAQIETDQMRDAYKSLHAVLTDITEELADDLTALETAALRVLIVHGWRRLTLKHPDLPRAAHSAEWRGHDCRMLVAGLLARYPRPDLDTIKPA